MKVEVAMQGTCSVNSHAKHAEVLGRQGHSIDQKSKHLEGRSCSISIHENSLPTLDIAVLIPLCHRADLKSHCVGGSLTETIP